MLALLFVPAFAISPIKSSAEGGCPDGTFPAGGGYCRNIVCREANFYRYAAGLDSGDDPKAAAMLKKYNKVCSLGFAAWGDLIIPKR